MRDERGHPWAAAALDLVMAPLARLRPATVRAARGRVLELGVGTGANLPLYAEGVDVVGVEPDPFMLARARQREARASVQLVQAPAEALPFDDASFDAVVSTFTLCTVDDLDAALREAARVLRPGGRLLLLEHVRSAWGHVACAQRAVDPAWTRLAAGCHLDRDPVSAAVRVGFEVDALRELAGGPVTPFPIVAGTLRWGAAADGDGPGAAGGRQPPST